MTAQRDWNPAQPHADPAKDPPWNNARVWGQSSTFSENPKSQIGYAIYKYKVHLGQSFSYPCVGPFPLLGRLTLKTKELYFNCVVVLALEH